MKQQLKNFGTKLARAAGIGLGYLAAYIGKWIIAPIVVIVALTYILLPYVTGKIVEIVIGVTLPPQEALSAREQLCWKTAIVDDAGSDAEAQEGIARVYKNAADAQKGPLKFCYVYENFLVTMPPSAKPEDAKTLRSVELVSAYQWVIRKSRLRAAEAIVDKYRSDPAAWLAKTSVYACAKWIVRAPRLLHGWEQPAKMEAETYSISKTKNGTDFRCLK